MFRVDDTFGQVIRIKYFIEGQGYTVEHTIIYQDNISTMILKTNGRCSSEKK